MSALNTFRSWASHGFHRARAEARMHDELQFHIDAYTDDLVRSGIAPADARRRALVEFGGVEARKDAKRRR